MVSLLYLSKVSIYRFYIFLIILLAISCVLSNAAYSPPRATVEPLYPKGIRISIPDEHGISLVAFHVNFNQDFEGLEAGTIARDIVKVRNGRWKYEDRTTELKEGDIVYYWVHVVYNGLGYNLIDQQHQVTNFYNLDGTIATKPTVAPTSCSRASETTWKSGARETENVNQACPGELIFEDTFETINGSRWKILEIFPGVPDYEYVIYRNSNANIKIQNNQMKITPTFVDDNFGEGFSRRGTIILRDCTGEAGTTECRRDARGSYILPPIMSSRMNTKERFAFRFGRVEVRAKLPRGDWLYPLISLENVENSGQPGKQSSEIRIASSSGNEQLTSLEGTDLSNHILWAGALIIDTVNRQDPRYTNRTSFPRKYSRSFWSEDYHVFEIEWSPIRIVSKVDGIIYGQQESLSPFDSYFYLNVGLAVGGHNEFPDQCRSGDYVKPWRNIGSKALFDFYCARENWSKTWTSDDSTLKLDYIKVFAL
ncbi:beta-1,3-glucan-binding protein 1-like [Prorops nasuta]|uniref:beta-1,3-glucan-binding protein 1-like n=1 Tax=Prorops nasuta TaxID=863751 RepID=UPI0034CDB052